MPVHKKGWRSFGDLRRRAANVGQGSSIFALETDRTVLLQFLLRTLLPAAHVQLVLERRKGETA